MTEQKDMSNYRRERERAVAGGGGGAPPMLTEQTVIRITAASVRERWQAAGVGPRRKLKK